MCPVPFSSRSLVLSKRRSARNPFLIATALAAILSPFNLAEVAGVIDALPIATPSAIAWPSTENVIAAASPDYHWTLDPGLSLQPETLVFRRNAPPEAAFKLNAARPDIWPDPPPPLAQKAPTRPLQSEFASSRPQSAVPLPVPRPSNPAQRVAETARIASQPVYRPTRSMAPDRLPAANPSFLEKLFGVQPSKPGLSYAALDTGAIGAPRTTRLNLDPGPTASAATAVYDISARLVYMPNGDKLEAHSGLGERIDDPSYVHVRMLGATPPGIYDLTEREQLFHGVRALRLNPIGGNAAVYGRTGLLAHTYMLGPNGDSNGCVSFKAYDRFLQAFLKGEVKRLVVVTGRGQDAVPAIANSRGGMPKRLAQSARDT
jgi:hypothetical protein